MSQDRSDRTPAPTRNPGEPPAASGRAEIDQFLHRVKALGPAVEPAIVYSIARPESEFNQRDTSPAKAVGLMQVTPEAGRDTARRLRQA